MQLSLLIPGLIVFLASYHLIHPVMANEPEIIKIGRFSEFSLEGWNEKSFQGNTVYQFVQLNGRAVLKAESTSSASGMFYEKKINLARTPVLNWQWKVDRIISNVNEKTRAGDDYPARVYVVFSGGLFFWKTRAINYVWSNNQATGTTWNNAYTDNARMIAVRAGKDQTGKWLSEKRNIRDDYRMLFGEDIVSADAVAIMTDTDNSGSTATAYYGDIYLTVD
jgi:hypothetical protein